MRAPVDPPFSQADALEKFPKILEYSRKYGGAECVAFEKYDGSNLGWRWDGHSWSQPFVRSGKSFGHHDPIFGKALKLQNDWWNGEQISARRIRQVLEGTGVLPGISRVENAVLFTEYLGPKSFSGEHVPGDDMSLRPIDFWIEGVGFLPPDEFCTIFAPPVVYRGKLTAKFVEDVRAGRAKDGAGVPVNEGVVAKGGTRGAIWCCKIKTRAWLARGGEA